MVRENEIRKAEVAVAIPPATDAGLVFIGRIRTPWTSRMETPRQGRSNGPLCRIEIFEPWVQALDSLAQFERVEVFYWLHLSRRDLVMQSPADDGTSRGTFSLRSPARPNPIGTSIAKLVSIEGATVTVRGSPLLDLKPDRALFTPIAPPQPGNFQVGVGDLKTRLRRFENSAGRMLSAAQGLRGAKGRERDARTRRSGG